MGPMLVNTSKATRRSRPNGRQHVGGESGWHVRAIIVPQNLIDSLARVLYWLEECFLLDAVGEG